MDWKYETWNPVTGCSPVSEGCDHCYARGIALRLQEMGVARYSRGFSVTTHLNALDKPSHWRKPRVVFVTSMGDLMHPEVPDGFILKVFDVMRHNSKHVFQLLTKRPERMAALCAGMEWPRNVWAGTTVESSARYDRLSSLLKVPAAVRFISFEPLLGAVDDVDLRGIRWAAVGGESGPDARPMKADWVRAIRDRCIREGVSFYFKQWGGPHHSSGGRTLDGRIWDQMPDPSGQLTLDF